MCWLSEGFMCTVKAVSDDGTGAASNNSNSNHLSYSPDTVLSSLPSHSYLVQDTILQNKHNFYVHLQMRMREVKWPGVTCPTLRTVAWPRADWIPPDRLQGGPWILWSMRSLSVWKIGDLIVKDATKMNVCKRWNRDEGRAWRVEKDEFWKRTLKETAQRSSDPLQKWPKHVLLTEEVAGLPLFSPPHRF